MRTDATRRPERRELLGLAERLLPTYSKAPLAGVLCEGYASGDSASDSHKKIMWNYPRGLAFAGRRRNTFATVAASHRLPVAVETPRAFSAPAIARNVVAPALPCATPTSILCSPSPRPSCATWANDWKRRR